ncbi:hypothetical protein HWV62_6515 [Athelia sp. TMB]|nr:hypothetical protein HWV62_6515 [Athelia sp. TMB]
MSATAALMGCLAFSFIPLTWGVGGVIGPMIGGVLSHPAEQWPSTAGRIPFLRQYPYALPCFTAALIPLGAFVFIAVFFRETLPSAMESKKRQATDTTLSADDDVSPPFPASEGPPALRALATKRVITCFGSFFVILSEAAPTKSSLGSINGLAQTVACTMRMFAPFIASSLFSLSQERNLLGGTMVFWIIEVVLISGVVASFRIEETPKSQEK